MLSNDYILGFVEGEGCFSIAISKNIDRRPRMAPGRRSNIKFPHLFQLKPSFIVTNAAVNKNLLEEIRTCVGAGNIYSAQRQHGNREQDIFQLRAQGIKDCLTIKNYFKDLVFQTTKVKDFILWCECLDLIEKKEHLTREGLLKICELRDRMNFRKTKNKWNKEEIEKILNEKPLHLTAHFDPNQAQLIHNKDNGLSEWLKAKQGNNKPNRFI